MYKNPELEKMTKEYLKKVRGYEIDFGDKDIQELKEIKQRLKPLLCVDILKQFLIILTDSFSYLS